jgi:hypothetical protein
LHEKWKNMSRTWTWTWRDNWSNAKAAKRGDCSDFRGTLQESKKPSQMLDSCLCSIDSSHYVVQRLTSWEVTKRRKKVKKEGSKNLDSFRYKVS